MIINFSLSDEKSFDDFKRYFYCVTFQNKEELRSHFDISKQKITLYRVCFNENSSLNVFADDEIQAIKEKLKNINIIRIRNLMNVCEFNI